MKLDQRFFRFVILLALSIISFQAKAAENEVINPIPADFQFQGKPISPLCIAEIANNYFDKISRANLLNCTKNEQKYKLTPYNEAIQKGFIGFDYSLKKSQDSYVPTESAYYKYLGKFNNFHVIYLVYSGGGSGSFSSVFLVERKGDRIEHIKNIVAVGDRCNGGIDKVSLKNNKLFYSIYITPYDYIDLSGIKLATVKSYDDLAACAACCQGTAQFESDFEKNNLVSIDLGDTPENSQGTYQECFNTLIKEYKQQGKQVLSSPKEIQEFVEQFKSKCLK